MRTFALLALAALLPVLDACGSPDSETHEMCGPNGTCPAGYECNPVDRRCYLAGTLSRDAALPAPDAATPDAPSPDAPTPDAGCPPPTMGPTLHMSTSIGADETWSADTGPHVVVGDLRLTGTAVLTIEACTEVQLAPSATVSVGLNGAATRLVTLGTEGRPVRFVARDAAPWSYIRINSPGTAALSYTTLAGGGADRFQAYATLSVIGDAQPGVRKLLAVDHVTVTGSQGHGVRLSRSAGFADGSTDLVVTGSGASAAADAPGQPIAIGFQAAGTLPTGAYTGNRVDAILLDGDAIVTEDMTLRDRGLPYDTGLSAAVRVRDATLTIDAGVVLRLAAGQYWAVGGTPSTGGTLVAAGTAERPVRFTAQPAAARWGSITAQAPGTVSLTQTILEDGGDDPGRADTTLVSWGDGTAPVDRNLLVDHVTIRRSKGAGVDVDRFGGFADGSTDLTVVDSGGDVFAAPLRVAVPAVFTIPPGSYTGNLADQIVVQTRTVEGSETFHDRGVPYVLRFGLSVLPRAPATVATLVLEPGVVLRFGAGAYLDLGGGSSASAPIPGVIKAVGTAEKPIVFTADSPTPAPGFWRGLTFHGIANDDNRIDHARIEYAGADCSCVGYGCSPDEDAAVLFFNYRPPSAFITNTTFAHIDGHGVTSGWSSDLDGPDFKPSNTFEDLKGCPQVIWKKLNGSCPADPCY